MIEVGHDFHDKCGKILHMRKSLEGRAVATRTEESELTGAQGKPWK